MSRAPRFHSNSNEKKNEILASRFHSGFRIQIKRKRDNSLRACMQHLSRVFVPVQMKRTRVNSSWGLRVTRFLSS